MMSHLSYDKGKNTGMSNDTLNTAMSIGILVTRQRQNKMLVDKGKNPLCSNTLL